MAQKDNSEKNLLAKIYSRILDYKPNRSERNKIAIVNAVVDCIADEGFDAVDYAAVSRRSGIRESQIHFSFPSKHDLVIAAIKMVFSEGQDYLITGIAESDQSPEARLEGYCAAIFKWMRENPKHCVVMKMMRHYSTAGETYSAVFERIITSSEERIEAILQTSKKGRPGEALQLARTIRAILTANTLVAFSPDNTELERQTINRIKSIAKPFWE